MYADDTSLSGAVRLIRELCSSPCNWFFLFAVPTKATTSDAVLPLDATFVYLKAAYDIYILRSVNRFYEAHRISSSDTCYEYNTTATHDPQPRQQACPIKLPLP
jgi:hypothetical protein